MDNGVSRVIVADCRGWVVAAESDRDFRDGWMAIERDGAGEEGVIVGGSGLGMPCEFQDPSLRPWRA